MDSTQPFVYRPLLKNLADHYVIRVVNMLPLEAGEDDSSPIRGNIEHVQICDCHLAAGEGPESLASRYPTVYFSKHVENRPEEDYETPHSIHSKKAKKKDFGSSLQRVTKGVSKLFKKSSSPPPSNSLPPETKRQLLVQAISNMVEFPEDTGGGLSMAWPADDSSSSSFRQKFKSSPKTVRPPERPHPDFHRKFDFGNYVALSYTWKPEAPKKRIYLQNGALLEPEVNSEFGFMDVGHNLDAALRKLRTIDLFKSGLPIWIDALCINQKADPKKGDTEKDEQFQAMSAIYKHAGNIVVWLGEGNETLYEAIDHIQDISKMYRTEWQEAFDEANLQYAHQHREGAAMHLKLVLEMWRTAAAQSRAAFWEDKENELVFEFFSLPYWRRLWVIQELAMGTADMTFIIGNRVTEWRYIRDAAFLYSAISDIFVESLSRAIVPTLIASDEQRLKERKKKVLKIGETINHVAEIAQLEIQGHRKILRSIMAPSNGYLNKLNSGPTAGPMRGSVIWQALRLISRAGCDDPRDKVLGIVALPGLPDLGITWDSTKSTVEVYTEFAKACINRSYRNPLEVLCLVDGATFYLEDTKGHPQELPSWVPNLASERETGIIEGTFRAGDKWTPYQIMGFEDLDSAPSIKFDARGNLQCHGFIIDVVDGLGPISSSDPDVSNTGFSPGMTQPSISSPWPIEDETPSTSLWRTFVAGTDDNGRRAPKEYSALLDAFVDGFNYSKTDYDLSPYEFVIDNAELMINGLPLSSWLPRWNLINSIMSMSKHRLDGMPVFQACPDCRGTINAAVQTMAIRTKRRRLMLTEKGYLGLVPNSVMPGDVVIIIKGHGRPLIASTKPASYVPQGTYIIKGEAYIDGMMSGEMMGNEHEKTWEDLTFI
ncbi:hypothetical protein V496_09611 [Pseudogymnoascus sp. VKM F-4515 (FW-2607)]|nr:hypothetical protein V496_09611 [Pseudogymnoascus sp. VKM F-4515 (FW-2607)]KFY88307.1 hypothetical protein V498_06832 [Pseudogymnoascus sp. VKM F-4517 (FW-2822)]